MISDAKKQQKFQKKVQLQLTNERNLQILDMLRLIMDRFLQ